MNCKCIYRKTVDYMFKMALDKTILEGFQWSGNFALQESRSRRALHQGWKWAFKIEQFSIDNFDFVIVVHSGKAFFI